MAEIRLLIPQKEEFMKRFLFCFLFLFLSFALFQPVTAQEVNFDTYHNPNSVNSLLKSWNIKYPQLTKIINIGKSEGNTDLFVLRIAAKNQVDPDSRTAVFVSANLEGTHLVGTEAALMLAHKLLTKYDADEKITQLLQNRTVYVAPLLNPDAAKSYFSDVRFERQTNGKPTDDDADGLVDEDGPDDLNKDGQITQIRVKDPEGTWLPQPDEMRLMKTADPNKGETGVYKIYTEGLDNDEDGEYNEDHAGGISINRNFPHDFEYGIRPAGLWPVSAKETIALLGFLTKQTNIALVLNFSSENTILNLQQTGRAQAAGDKFKVPARFANFLGLDPEQEFTMQELIDLLNSMNIGGGIEINESIVAMILGLGPAMNIDQQDMPMIQAIQKEYKDALKEAKLEDLEKRAKGVGKGSFAAYCYFQYGVPVFSTDLWKVPEPKKELAKDALTVDKLKSMSSEDFLSLEDDVMAAFLKEQGAPDNFKPEMIKKMVESGQVDLDWTHFKHPTLGDVEIGGFVPFLKTTPPSSLIKETITFHTDFYIGLMSRLPEMKVKETKVEALGNSLYEVTVYLTNEGWFPTSTSQGRRARTAWPIRVELKTADGQMIFSGRKLVTIPFINGSGDTKKTEWTVQGKKGSKITITAKSPRLGSVTTILDLE